MRCEELTLRLSPYLDGELDGAERARVTAHLASCPACAALHRRLAALDGLSASAFPVLTPGPDLWARVAAGLDASPAAPVSRPWARLLLAAAATGLVALALAGLWWREAGAPTPARLQAELQRYAEQRQAIIAQGSPFTADFDLSLAGRTENPFTRFVRVRPINPFEEQE